MKHYLNTYLISLSIFILSSCSMKLDGYSDANNYIGFAVEDNSNVSVKEEINIIDNYSFSALSSETKEMTVYTEVEIMGSFSDIDRTFAFTQYTVKDELNAESDKHFAKISGNCIVKAGEASVKLPITFKRESLGDSVYSLGIQLVANNDFLLAEAVTQRRILTISDKLVPFSNWEKHYGENWNVANYIFGDYGLEKHKIMRDVLASKGEQISEKWLEEVLSTDDSTIFAYWQGQFTLELNRINKERKALGQKELTESEKYRSVIVSFNF